MEDIHQRLRTVSNGFAIADPNDARMMDGVGFDTATPQVIRDFAVDLM